jgi:hypothetical protein
MVIAKEQGARQNYLYKLFFEYLLNEKSEEFLKQCVEYRTTEDIINLRFEFDKYMKSKVPINSETVYFHFFYFISSMDQAYTYLDLYKSVISHFRGDPSTYIVILKQNGMDVTFLNNYAVEKKKQRNEVLNLENIKSAMYIKQKLTLFLEDMYNPEDMKKLIGAAIKNFNFEKYDFFK